MSLTDNILWKGAGVIRDGGFIKANLYTSEGHCAIGALVASEKKDFGSNTQQAAKWIEANHADEAKVLADTIKSLFGSRLGAAMSNTGVIIRFNDHHETTEEDVVKVMRVAAVKLSAGV